MYDQPSTDLFKFALLWEVQVGDQVVFPCSYPYATNILTMYYTVSLNQQYPLVK